jgi:transcriptional regulator with XRE-family HTH domain
MSERLNPFRPNAPLICACRLSSITRIAPVWDQRELSVRNSNNAIVEDARPAIARRLIQVRLRSGLNQTAFADRLGFARRTYLGWERAESDPPIWLLDALEREFDIDPLWLLRGPGDTPRAHGETIDWERFGRLIDKAERINSELGLAPSARQVMQHARGIFRTPPGSDEEGIQQLEETLRTSHGVGRG